VEQLLVLLTNITAARKKLPGLTLVYLSQAPLFRLGRFLANLRFAEKTSPW
jgi:hypothetical protein